MQSDNDKPRPASRVHGRPDGEPITVFVGQYEAGFKVGVDEGSKKPEEKTEQRLAEHAASAAQCLSAAPYDPGWKL